MNKQKAITEIFKARLSVYLDFQTKWCDLLSSIEYTRGQMEDMAENGQTLIIDGDLGLLISVY